MTLAHLFFAWLDSALLVSTILLWLTNRFALKRNVLVALVVLLAIVLLIPVRGLSLFMYVWSILGDFSFLTKAYLFAWLLYRLGGPVAMDTKEIQYVFRGVAVVGIAFYPLALGLSPLDPYAWGFSPSILIIVNIVLIAFAMRKGFYVLTAGLIMALWAFLLGLMESNNLLDYLIDPLLFLYALGYTCVTFLRQRNSKSVTG